MPIYIGDNTPCSFQFNKYPPKVAPKVSIAIYKRVVDGVKCLTFVGKFEDYEHKHLYFDEVSAEDLGYKAHGILFIQTNRLYGRTLTMNSSGRTRVGFGSYNENGAFTYTYGGSDGTGISASVDYTARAFYVYKNTITGKQITMYSAPIVSSFNKSPEWET